jgi:hypothetical protein
MPQNCLGKKISVYSSQCEERKPFMPSTWNKLTGKSSKILQWLYEVTSERDVKHTRL